MEWLEPDPQALTGNCYRMGCDIIYHPKPGMEKLLEQKREELYSKYKTLEEAAYSP